MSSGDPKKPATRRGPGPMAGPARFMGGGPIERSITLETGSADRGENMEAFAKRALELFGEVIAVK